MFRQITGKLGLHTGELSHFFIVLKCSSAKEHTKIELGAISSEILSWRNPVGSIDLDAKHKDSHLGHSRGYQDTPEKWVSALPASSPLSLESSR
jgi:hypothetical protein